MQKVKFTVILQPEYYSIETMVVEIKKDYFKFIRKSLYNVVCLKFLIDVTVRPTSHETFLHTILRYCAKMILR